jgi:DNA repair exonuclease SbcCD ATPase subunit
MPTEIFYFNFVKVEGYRGRNFELKFNPPGTPSVFLMENDTGKTTLIELIRWCFKYPESDAEGKFIHMHHKSTNVLDFRRKEKQNCRIDIGFTLDKNKYIFSRETIGEHKREEEAFEELGEKKFRVGKDVIESITDTLNLNNGQKIFKKDDVFNEIENKMHLAQCADYFCFDGEKAREIMESSTIDSEIKNIINTINQRATHPKVEGFKNDLADLKTKIYKHVQSSVKAKVSKPTITAHLNKITDLEKALSAFRVQHQLISDKLNASIRILEGAQQEYNQLNTQIIETKSKTLSEINKIDDQIQNQKKHIADTRTRIYQEMMNWHLHLPAGKIQEIKNEIREKGKIPEPYHDDLITSCLNSNPPRCLICNRILDTDSEKHIRNLEKLLAEEYVHNFLTKDFELSPENIDLSDFNQQVQEDIERISSLEMKKQTFDLSEEDKNAIQKRSEKDEVIRSTQSKIGEYKLGVAGLLENIRQTEEELNAERAKVEVLKEYQEIFKEIDSTLTILNETQENMKEETIRILSGVLNNSIRNALGPDFGAVITKKYGLQLTLGDTMGSDIGGMAARIILSYCFAESISTIDPIIADSPAGAIGIYREKLAQHLKRNHKQLILLCIGAEKEFFANVISGDVIAVSNKNYDYPKEGVAS